MLSLAELKLRIKDKIESTAQMEDQMKRNESEMSTKTNGKTRCLRSTRKNFTFKMSTTSGKREQDEKQDEKPYGCTICSKKFKQSTSLRCHVNLHTGLRVFRCRFCERAFPRKITWLEHERRHTGEAPYTCKLCSRSFKQKSCLHYHQLGHRGLKPHVCATCGKGFVIRSALKIHTRTHTGEKPFQCELCGKRFAHKANLKYHVLQHVYYNRRRCKTCMKIFPGEKELKTHQCPGKRIELNFLELKARVKKMLMVAEDSQKVDNSLQSVDIVTRLREKVKDLMRTTNR